MSQIDALSCINFATNLAPFWNGFGSHFGSKLAPHWLQIAQKIDSKSHQTTDAMLYRILVDFWPILEGRQRSTWGEKGLLY